LVVKFVVFVKESTMSMIILIGAVDPIMGNGVVKFGGAVDKKPKMLLVVG